MKLHDIRRALGLTQEECGTIIGVDSSTFSRIENGERAVSHAELVKLSEHLGFSVDYIVAVGAKPEDKIVQMIRDQRAKIKALLRAKGRAPAS